MALDQQFKNWTIQKPDHSKTGPSDFLSQKLSSLPTGLVRKMVQILDDDCTSCPVSTISQALNNAKQYYLFPKF
jgi:hypothetical protein